MTKIKLTHCSICKKKFTSGHSIVKKTRYDGMLGMIPLSLHKKCHDNLMTKDELMWKDNNNL